MARARPPVIAVLWAQFAAYHVDRCIAIAERLGSRAELVAVEVAGLSDTYAWEPSGDIPGVRKTTLFLDTAFERIGRFRRFIAQFRILRRCDVVFVGIGYNEPDIIALSFLLPLFGVKVFVMSDSKFEDAPRSLRREAGKALLLSAYSGAIVAGRRQLEYFRFLGFRRRMVLPGYDGVGLQRIRELQTTAGTVDHSDRFFLYVGRFVEKKNLGELIDGYAAYARQAGPSARCLTLAGSGPLEPILRAQIADLGIEHLIDLPGFLSAPQVATMLPKALALVLVSRVEQWGLVINEALAAALPVIASPAVGAGDALIRNLLNGFIIENGSPEGIAEAMRILADDRVVWERMAAASRDRAWLGDAERLADAIEVFVCPPATAAAGRIAAVRATLCVPTDGAEP